MSSNFDEIFVLAISETLSQWKSFQLALENGMGGKDSKEKLIWMIEVIKQFFKDNNDLMIEEVMEFIAQIIDNEFDTIIEDGSLQMISSSLCKYYQLCSSGREQEVKQKLDDIKKLNNNCINASNNCVKCDNQMVVESGMQSLNIEDNEETNGLNVNEKESDGWTLVQRKHKK